MTACTICSEDVHNAKNQRQSARFVGRAETQLDSDVYQGTTRTSCSNLSPNHVKMMKSN